MEPAVDQFLIARRQFGKDGFQLPQGRLAAQLQHHVAFGFGDHEMPADRAAALRHHRPDADRSGDHEGHGAFVVSRSAQQQAALARHRSAAGHPADHHRVRMLIVRLFQQVIGGKTERVAQQQQTRLRWPAVQQRIGPAHDRRPLGRVAERQVDRLHVDAGQFGEPQRGRRLALDLPAAAHERLARTTDQPAGAEPVADRRSNLSRSIGRVGRQEQHRQIGRAAQFGSCLLADLDRRAPRIGSRGKRRSESKTFRGRCHRKSCPS